MPDESLRRFTTALIEPPPPRRRSPIRAYAIAVLLTVGALALTAAVPALWARSTLVLPLAAVMLSAWHGGRGPGLLSTGITVAALAALSLRAIPSADPVDDALRLVLFAGLGGGTVLLAGASHAAGGLMREQWDMCRVTLTSIGDAVIVTDAAARVTFMNGVAESLTGWPRGDGYGRPLTEVFHIVNEATRDVVDSPVSRAARDGTVVGLANHTVLVARDGAERPIDDSAAPIRDRSGRVIGVVLVFRDVTERKRADEEREELLRRERSARLDAETANRAKDEFLATMSHELRTPLTAILGWATVVRIAQSDPELVARALETIERNAMAQARIVDDILDVSRIVTGRLHLDVRPVDLVSVVGAVLDTVRPAAEAKGLTLDAALDPAAGPVLGDAVRLQQVVWNIVSNAVKFTPSGGRVDVTLAPGGSSVMIRVRDTGQGIAPAFLPHVFQRFTQAESGTTRRQSGLGLGLAIARHLVELHGGTITASSAGEGLGAELTITLPVRLAPAAAAVEPPAAARSLPSLAGLRVLIVEDEPDNRGLLVQVLERCGARVTAAASASEALAALDGDRYDVLLSDLHLQGDDGYALIRSVRRRPPEANGRIPAAALTAYARPEDRRQVLAAGFQEHVPKPVDVVQLAQLVGRLAGRDA